MKRVLPTFFDQKRAKISKFEKSTPMFFIKKQSKLTNLKRVTPMLFYQKTAKISKWGLTKLSKKQGGVIWRGGHLEWIPLILNPLPFKDRFWFLKEGGFSKRHEVFILFTLDEFQCSFENTWFSIVFTHFGLKLDFIYM